MHKKAIGLACLLGLGWLWGWTAPAQALADSITGVQGDGFIHHRSAALSGHRRLSSALLQKPDKRTLVDYAHL
jgi:hypothetical protein